MKSKFSAETRRWACEFVDSGLTAGKKDTISTFLRAKQAEVCKSSKTEPAPEYPGASHILLFIKAIAAERKRRNTAKFAQKMKIAKENRKTAEEEREAAEAKSLLH